MVAAAGGTVAAMSVVAAELSGSTAAVAIGLAVVGFVMGVLPRLGPAFGSVQLPLLSAGAAGRGARRQEPRAACAA